jgi:branched-chain amino acid transport system substrate-binding protein
VSQFYSGINEQGVVYSNYLEKGDREMRKWAFIVGLVTVLWLATGVYCPLQAQGSEEIIRIGGFAPFTGPVADVGQQIREGIELAAKHMEKEGIIINGKPHKIQLFWGDTESKPEVGLSVVEKLITVKRIQPSS